MINKMPVVIQKTLIFTNSQLMTVIPRIRTIIDQAMKDANLAKDEKALG
ncbi:hypothetical protein [Amphibiibacter pelophylacis]|uniref:Uncharacterized protein n=1 Tax=Amphibiibacter pelophylacis TaxID=1799477 RepID=A0ACC6P332_9BURK